MNLSTRDPGSVSCGRSLYSPLPTLVFSFQSGKNFDPKFIDNVKNEIEALKSKLHTTKKTDFIKFKQEIKQILETHIVSRYYFEKGKVLQSFQYDKEVDLGKEIINNSIKTNAILAGDGIYKTVGSLK